MGQFTGHQEYTQCLKLKNVRTQRTDFLQLLQPVELPASVVKSLFKIGLDSHSDVVFFPAEVTTELTTGTLRRYRRLDDGNGSLHAMRHSLFNLPRAVFLFGTDSHYTVVLTDRDKNRSALRTV